MRQGPEDRQKTYSRPPVRRRRRKTPWQRFKEAYLPPLIILLALVAVIALIVSGVKRSHKPKAPEQTTASTTGETTPSGGQDSDVQSLLAQAKRLADQYDYDGALALLNPRAAEGGEIAQAVSAYETAKSGLKLWADVTKIPHISFQPLIVDTARAFDGDQNEGYYNRNNLTISEFTGILDQLYQNGYVLVSMSDLAAPNEAGAYTAGSLYLPEGKKPLVLSEVPVHYTAAMAADGFARRLAAGPDGKPVCEYVDADGQTLTGSYDLVPVLEDFLAQHPDFSYRGARAVLAVAGSEGILGYSLSDETEAAAAKAAAQCLRDNGYEFASFTYAGVAYGEESASTVQADAKKWVDTVGPVVGETEILFYAGGSDIGGAGDYSGEKYEALTGAGFRYFCSINNSDPSWVQIKDGYVRQARRTVNGTRITTQPELLKDLFDAAKVASQDRPAG